MSDSIDDIVKLSPDVHQVIFENAAIRVLEVRAAGHPGTRRPTCGGECRRHRGADDLHRAQAMSVRRMDHVGIVVDDLDAAIAFFVELGLTAQPRMVVDGNWVDRVVGLEAVRVEIAMMRTPDGHSRLELTKFLSPPVIGGEPYPAPANTLGLRRIMFAVDDIHDVVGRLRTRGGELVGEIAQYEDTYLLCYLRGPSGIIVALAEALA